MAFSGTRLAVTNRTAESWWLFLAKLLAVTNSTAESSWLFLAHVWPQQIVLRSLGGSFCPSLGRNKSYCQVLLALSGLRLAATNRTAESWWLFPSLGGFFWPTLGRNKSYCRVLVALSGPRLAVTKRTAESWCHVLANLLAVTNRTAESWWLFLANSWP